MGKYLEDCQIQKKNGTYSFLYGQIRKNFLPQGLWVRHLKVRVILGEPILWSNEDMGLNILVIIIILYIIYIKGFDSLWRPSKYSTSKLYGHFLLCACSLVVYNQSQDSTINLS